MRPAFLVALGLALLLGGSVWIGTHLEAVPWHEPNDVVTICTRRVEAAMAYWHHQGRDPVRAESLMDACLLHEVTGSTR